MVNCGVCHKSIKVTRDQHYYDDKTRKRYHLACIVDVCPECNKPITKAQKHKEQDHQEYHLACVPEIPLFNRENPIGVTSGEDFLKWWSQGLSLGLIRLDGTVVDWPDWGRWTDWWSHGLLLGIVSTTPNLHLESGENIIDYLVRRFTLGFITTGGKPSVLQKKANEMAKQEIIPKISLPKLPDSYIRTNPGERWVDEDEMRRNPIPLLIPAAMMAAPMVTDAIGKATASPAPPQRPQAPAPASLPQPNPSDLDLFDRRFAEKMNISILDARNIRLREERSRGGMRTNPSEVHYILIGKDAHVYANRWGSKKEAETEASNIHKRSGVKVSIVYPDKKEKSEAKKVASLIKGS
jgi:hypothetical protein